MKTSVTWKIGGEAGFGIMSAGTMISRAFARLGYHTFATNEYPSLIRGGHNLVTVKISTLHFDAMNKDVHILTALNKETVLLHRDELRDDAYVVYDPKDYQWSESDFSVRVNLIALPLTDIVAKLHGDKVMRNTVALGATIALLGADLESFSLVIKDQFGKKGEEIVSQNIAIAKEGYGVIRNQFGDKTTYYLEKTSFIEHHMILNASEALGIGAVRAGMKFAAVYPMTPINAVISFLADHEKSLDVVYLQPEDEIAGINMAIGASVSGVRSLVATSGGGYALQVEGTSLAGMMEVPLVIDMGMRPGPASGMPTWTAQGELQFILHAGHGDFLRFVIAPADAKEAYEETIRAFHLADKYQTPVFLLTDKYLNESQWCVPKSYFSKDLVIDRGKVVHDNELSEDSSFKRYNTNVTDGISPRSFFGQKHGCYASNSYEHDEFGFVTESASQANAMAQKRLQKYKTAESDIIPPQVYGSDDPEITLITWGSSRGAALEAMRRLEDMGTRTRLVHYTWIYPFPIDATKKVLGQGGSRLIGIELNGTGQMTALIREQTGIEISEKLLKTDGRQLYEEDIISFVKGKTV